MASTALLTDKYELTMLSAALRNGKAHKKATFEAFARKLPAGRKYGVVAGMHRIFEAVENFRFDADQIEFLRRDGLDEATLGYLRDFRFQGAMTGYRDGDLYFPYSPVLTVEGTFGEAVLLETVILSILNHDCAVASAASRVVASAQGIPTMELGARRTHEMAAVAASYAAYVAGFAGTSNLEAAAKYGIPAFGTSAHAFVLAHDTEREAFAAQVAALGPGTTLLVDTYNIEQGIRTAVEVSGTELGAIRIDSGDLFEEATKARALLDSLGATKTNITVSSDLDEYTIDELMNGHPDPAPIDSFGVGTRVVTGSGHPTASMVYKLVEIEAEDGSMRPVAKASSGKRSIGGKKLAWRVVDALDAPMAEVIVARQEGSAPPAHLLEAASHRLVSLQSPLTAERDLPDRAREVHRTQLNNLPALTKTVEAGQPIIPTLDADGERI